MKFSLRQPKQKVMLAELEMEAEALDTIDPGIVAEYREAQEVEDFVNLVVVILSFCLRL